MIPKPGEEELGRLREMLEDAFEGRIRWLHDLIAKAGYLHPRRLSANDVGELWRVSRQAVGGWRRRGCPCNADRSYDLGEVLAWREAGIARRAATDAGLGEAQNAALEEKRKWEALMAKAKYEEWTGQLLRAEDVERERVARVSAVCVALEGLVRGAGIVLEGQMADRIESYLRERVNAMRDEFAGEMEN